jgi:hypothetical protein
MGMPDLEARLRDVVVAAAEETLQARGEPAPFARLHCHIWEALARRGILQRIMVTKEPASPLDWVRKQIQKALQDQLGSTFVQVWAAQSPPEDGETAEESECLWWLVHGPDVPPLTERVEQAVYEALAAVETATTAELLATVYARFRGMLIPTDEWVLACLRSYGHQIASGQWTLQEGERSSERAKARERMLYTLRNLGERWGYEVKLAQGLALRWVQGGKQPVVWAILDTAALSPLLKAASTELAAGARRLAVISDARQDLMALRWARAPLMREELAARSWQFIHEQDLLHWAEQHNLTLSDLDTLVSMDPLAVHGRTQLPLM